MAEFSSLNGYAVKDNVARSIAKGRNQAVAFVDYATMIETLNELEKDEYKAGQNIYIGVVGVPDLWVYSVEDIRHTCAYVSDEDFVEKLNTNTTVQVGFFKLAMLEGQKVDLTTYDQHLAEHDADIRELNEDVEALTNNVGNINVYVGGDKKIHFVDKDGADSVLPFSSGWCASGNCTIPQTGKYYVYALGCAWCVDAWNGNNYTMRVYRNGTQIYGNSCFNTSSDSVAGSLSHAQEYTFNEGDSITYSISTGGSVKNIGSILVVARVGS